jgi:hypothetical protein
MTKMFFFLAARLSSLNCKAPRPMERGEINELRVVVYIYEALPDRFVSQLLPARRTLSPRRREKGSMAVERLMNSSEEAEWGNATIYYCD